MGDILAALANLAVGIFVITSMLSMGLSLTTGQIIAPLRNKRLVILALGANFVLVPIIAYAITLVLPVTETVRVGLILISTAAGAPLLPKLATTAKGNVALAVGLMVLLVVVTIIYMPLVLPLLLGDVEVSAWEIAQSLIVMLLTPLAIGLFTRARFENTAVRIQPTFGLVANIAFYVMIVLGLLLNVDSLIALIGAFGILAGVLLVTLSLVVGYFMGGSDSSIKSVTGLGTAMRNVSAALVVASLNFDSTVVSYMIVMLLISLVILMPAARVLGKRMGQAAGEEKGAANA